MPEKLKYNGLITAEEVKELSQAMSSIDWHNPMERRAIAEVIVKIVQDDIIMDDLSSLLCDVETFGLGQTPEFVTRKGLKAYVHEPGSYAPRSTITNTIQTITAEQVSVVPEMELGQLKTGRYGTIADIRKMAKDELNGHKNAIIWNTILGSIATTDTNYGAFASSATADTKKAALDAALSYVNDNNNAGAKAIVGRYTALDWISDITGFSDKVKDEIQKEGVLGLYRGVPIVRLHQYTDAYHVNRITDNRIIIVGNGSTKLGITQNLEVMDEIDMNTKMWALRMDERYGVVVLKPERNYKIVIS